MYAVYAAAGLAGSRRGANEESRIGEGVGGPEGSEETEVYPAVGPVVIFVVTTWPANKDKYRLRFSCTRVEEKARGKEKKSARSVRRKKKRVGTEDRG